MNDEAPQGRAPLACRSDCREEDRASGELQVGRSADDRRIVAAELEQGAAKSLRYDRRNHSSHSCRPRCRNERDASVANQSFADLALALDELDETVRSKTEPAPRTAHQLHHQLRAKGSLLAWFPDHRIAADECQRCIPGPDRNRKVEGADHQYWS